jgi:hypothetical protein
MSSLRTQGRRLCKEAHLSSTDEVRIGISNGTGGKHNFAISPQVSREFFQ